jgi:hypothetical protein
VKSFDNIKIDEQKIKTKVTYRPFDNSIFYYDTKLWKEVEKR